MLQAGAGRVDAAFMQRHKPRLDVGIGTQARTDEHPMFLDEMAIKCELPLAYQDGVRSVGAFPLRLGDRIDGVLYLQFWETPHVFSPEEIELEKTFATLVECALQSNLLLDTASEAADTVWTLSRFQTVLEALASNSDAHEVLEAVAKNLLLMLDADNVTLYEYSQATNSFRVPPVRKGSFLSPDDLGVAILERRSTPGDIDVSDPVRCGIASSCRSLQRGRQL